MTRQSGSRGTLRSRARPATLDISFEGVARTLEMLEDLERAHAVERPVVERQLVRPSAAANESSPRLDVCHSARKGVVAEVDADRRHARTRARDARSRRPRRTRRRESSWVEASRSTRSISRRKRWSSVRVTGFPLAYLSVALPDGPTKSAASATVAPASAQNLFDHQLDPLALVHALLVLRRDELGEQPERDELDPDDEEQHAERQERAVSRWPRPRASAR